MRNPNDSFYFYFYCFANVPEAARRKEASESDTAGWREGVGVGGRRRASLVSVLHLCLMIHSIWPQSICPRSYSHLIHQAQPCTVPEIWLNRSALNGNLWRNKALHSVTSLDNDRRENCTRWNPNLHDCAWFFIIYLFFLALMMSLQVKRGNWGEQQDGVMNMLLMLFAGCCKCQWGIKERPKYKK